MEKYNKKSQEQTLNAIKKNLESLKDQVFDLTNMGEVNPAYDEREAAIKRWTVIRKKYLKARKELDDSRRSGKENRRKFDALAPQYEQACSELKRALTHAEEVFRLADPGMEIFNLVENIQKKY